MIKKLISLVLTLLLSSVFLFSQSKYSVIDTLIDGHSVQMKMNNKTGAIHRIYGLRNFAEKNEKITEQNIISLSAKFLQNNKKLLRVVPQDLQLMRSEKRKNRWHLSYRQYYKNVPVYHSYLGYTVYEDGNILSLGSDIHPDISMDINPSITESQALQIAKEKFKELSKIEIPNIRKSPELTILPVENDNGYAYYLVYNIELDFIDSTHVFSQSYFIDAHSGQIINEYSNIRNASIYGTVKLKYYPEHYDDTPVEDGGWEGGQVNLYNVLGQLVGTRTTNSSGYYNFFNISYGYYTLKSNFTSTSLSNPYVNIYNMENQVHEVGVYPGVHNWGWVGDETNVFYHADWIHNFYKSSPFYYNGMDYQMDVYLYGLYKDGNYYEDYLNGWADGYSIGFGSYDIDNDGTPEEWARSSDVVYHEYTHNTNYHLYGYRWIGYDKVKEGRAMDEGFADYFACSINDHHIQGESVKVNRNLDNTKTMDDYHGDEPNEYYYPGVQYDNSLIISGACWDVRENEQIGAALANELIFDALAYDPHAFYFANFLDNLLLADDDPSHGGDNIISNGTPHIDAILYAFDNHKIYPSDPNVPPAKPKSLSLSSQSGQAYLTWDDHNKSEPDFSHYKVYRKLDPDPFHPRVIFYYIASTVNNEYVDPEFSPYQGGGATGWYKIRAVDNSNIQSNYSNTVSSDGYIRLDKPIIAFNSGTDTPNCYRLYSNSPNPFNPTTTIRYDLPEDSHVSLIIYDIRGNEVEKLVNGEQSAGYKSITWNPSQLGSGVYLYIIQVTHDGEVKLDNIGKMLFVK